MDTIKKSVQYDYETFVKKKVLFAKKKVIKKWQKRKDYDAMLSV